jgi:hypothetical protein
MIAAGFAQVNLSPTGPLERALVYAGRAGTGIDTGELQRLWRRLQPLGLAVVQNARLHANLTTKKAIGNGISIG